MHRHPSLIAGLILCLLGFAVPAQASCTVSSPTLPFGVYDPLAVTPLDMTATLTVTCGGIGGLLGVLVSYTVSASTGNSGSFASRHLVNATETLNYNVFLNAARTQIWGDGTGGTFLISGSMLLSLLISQTHTHTLYGRIPAGQNPAWGNYSDTLILTVTF